MSVEVCDFCGGPGPRWDYRVRAHTTQRGRVVIHDSGDGWSACDACHELIERGDRDALVDRAAARFPLRKRVPRKLVRQTIAAVQRCGPAPRC